MIRTVANRKIWLAAFALCTGAIAGLNCSKESPDKARPGVNNVGAIGMAVTLRNGADVQSVAYRVTGPNMYLRTGSIPVPGAQDRVTVYISGLPAGPGYEAELTATSQDGATTCAGRRPFTVLANTTVNVNVVLLCMTRGGDRGNAIINGTFNHCPTVTGATATPGSVIVGNSLALAVESADVEGDTLTFAWSAPSGTFSAGTSATTNYTCTQAGVAIPITVAISDGQCGDNLVLTVDCTTVACGNGTVEPGLGEQCDPPNPANFCDMNCRNIPQCGNNVVEMGEQCDPPNMVPGMNTCNAMCQNVPIACGNSLVQPGEQCDPPNGTTCSPTCQNQAPVVCGDGVVEGPPRGMEECDPPNGTTCDMNCRRIDQCNPCYQQAIADGNCPNAREGACADIPPGGVGPGATPNDRSLCEAADVCIKMTGCWTTAEGVKRCFCGDALGVACASPAANGACKAQLMAATRAMNETQAGTALLSLNVPAGYTTQKYACQNAFCLSVCQ